MGGEPRCRAPAEGQCDLSSIRYSGAVRRANRSVSPWTCSTKVLRSQSGAAHMNRRTKRSIVVRCPATAASASRRRYPPWTRSDAMPQPGQTARRVPVRAEKVIVPLVSTTSSTVSAER